MLATTFGVGQVAYSLLWFALLFLEIWLIIMVVSDVFASRDMRGWMKALWVVLVIVFPLVGVLAYLIFRGDKLRQHQIQAAEEQEQAFRRYVEDVVRDVESSRADEIAKLLALRDSGAISLEQYEYLKDRVVGMSRGPDPVAT